MKISVPFLSHPTEKTAPKRSALRLTSRLLLLNGIAALMVPIHHATSFGFQAMFEWTHRYRDVAVPNYEQLGTFPYHALMLSRSLTASAVPAFFFVSGFFIAFMARGKDAHVDSNMVLPRVKKLIPPVLLWVIIRHALVFRRLPNSVGEILEPYYFLILLIQYYLLAPILAPVAKSNWRLLLLATGLLQLLVNGGLDYLVLLGLHTPAWASAIAALPKWSFPARIFYFTIGLVAGVHATAFKQWLLRARWAIVTAVIALGPLSAAEHWFLSRQTPVAWSGPDLPALSGFAYMALFSLGFLALGAFSIPGQRSLNNLGTKSLGIYLAHIPAMYVVAVALYRYAPWTLGNQLVYQLTLIGAGLAGPLLLMTLMRRTPARRWYPYVFG